MKLLSILRRARIPLRGRLRSFHGDYHLAKRSPPPGDSQRPRPQSPMKQTKQRPLRAKHERPAPVVLVRSERRSWIALAVTAFGALLVRYFKSVRERSHTTRPR